MSSELLRRVKAACCRLKSPIGMGTGYLVGDRQIATCAHVIQNFPLGKQLTAQFGDSNSPHMLAEVRVQDPKSDSALLELLEPLPGAVPLELGSAPDFDASWIAYGFPAFADMLGVVLTGNVMDPDTEIPGGLRGLALYSRILGANPPTSVGGFSGSPVVVGERVVGHISSVLGVKGAMQEPQLGYAYAAPIDAILVALGKPLPAQPVRQLPTLEARIIQLSTAYSELQCAASRGDLQRAIANARTTGSYNSGFRTRAAEVALGLMLPDDALALLEKLPSGRAIELRALALSFKGQHAEARGLTHSLAFSAESRGIEGGILKRRWFATKNELFLRDAFKTYFEAYTMLRDPYPGVNAAACALYLGQRAKSESIARELVLALEHEASRDEWQEASLAEAYLLCGELAKARVQYEVATRALAGKPRNLAVMRAQALRNLKWLSLPPDSFADALPSAPGVAAFTGHRTGKYFEQARSASVRAQLAEMLDERQVQYGYCSAASGSDLLFIELLIERGLDVEVFLPFPREHFKRTSVGPDPAWLARFDKALDHPQVNVTELSEDAPKEDDSTPYILCNEAIQEAARKRAAGLGASPFLLAVVAAAAEVDEPAPGGAVHAVRCWIARGEADIVKVDPSA